MSFWTVLREKHSADPQRPRYHFLPPANWMNDPNGPIFWRGKYHLFYQHNPHAPVPGNIHWGHAVSRDLVHWTHLPIALSPTPGGPDKDGCWTGCTVNDNGVPTIVYTGVHPEVQCIATSDSDMIDWEKNPGNPVIDSPPKGLEVTGFRDPCVWRENDYWHMVIGSGIKGVGGASLLYRSKNLINWEYLNPLCIGDEKETGRMWECPDFFPLGDKHLLIVSVWPETLYFTGTYAEHKFQIEHKGRIDGGHYYAAKSMLDEKGRRILFGWVTEGRSAAAQYASGWAGVQALPRILSLRGDGVLNIEPIPELKVLRDKRCEYGDLRVNPLSSPLLEEIQGDCLEIEAEFEPGDAEKTGLKVRCTLDNAEETLIFYDTRRRSLNIDRERSSLHPDVSREPQEAPLKLTDGETLKLHVFLDRSVIEVFANNRVCLTSRIYPSRIDSLHTGVYTRGGSAKIKTMNIWNIKSIW